MRLIRWGGFAAACALATAGVLGGAWPDGDLASNPVTVARGPYGPVILVCWLLGMAGLGAAWWAARDRVPSARWAIGTAVLWAVPFLLVPPTGSRDAYSYACQGDLYLGGLSPYDFGVATLPCPWLEAVSPIWRETPAPYGPLFVLLAALAVLIGGDLPGIVGVLRLLSVAGLVLVAAGVPALARRCGVPSGRALWLSLAAPLVGFHLLGGPHNDALLIGLLVAALALIATNRRLAVPAGILLGLATAIKVTAIVIVPFAVLMVLPGPVRRATFVRASLLVGGPVVAVMAAFSVAAGLGLGWVTALSHSQDLVQFTSPPTAVGMTISYAGKIFDPGFDAVPAVRLIALIACAVALIVIWFRTLRADDLVPAAVRGAGLATAVAIALAPSYHAWYVMLPLTLLAVSTTRTTLVMLATLASSALVLPDGGGLSRFVKGPGAILVTAGLGVWAYRWWRARRSEPADSEPVVSH